MFLANETWDLFRGREREVREIARVVNRSDVGDDGCLRRWEGGQYRRACAYVLDFEGTHPDFTPFKGVPVDAPKPRMV